MLKPLWVTWDCRNCGFVWKSNLYMNYRCPNCGSRIGIPHILGCLYLARLKHWEKYGGIKPLATDKIHFGAMRTKEMLISLGLDWEP